MARVLRLKIMMLCRFILLFLLGGTVASAITPGSQEIDLANRIQNQSGQQRAQFVYDPILNLVARAKAKDLAKRHYFSHTDPDGYGPNKAAQLAGYQFPGFWGTANATNYIESVTAGWTTAAAALSDWLGSPAHKQHVLGESAFYAGQTRYGVGYVYDPTSDYQHYWIFISAPPNPSAYPALEPYAEWLFDRYSPKQIDQTPDSDDADGDGIPRLMEFALSLDPAVKNTMTRPALSTDGLRLEWALALRPDLGTIRAEVQSCPNLSNWQPGGVNFDNGIYWVSTSGPASFLRLSVERTH